MTIDKYDQDYDKKLEAESERNNEDRKKGARKLQQT